MVVSAVAGLASSVVCHLAFVADTELAAGLEVAKLYIGVVAEQAGQEAEEDHHTSLVFVG